MGLFFTIFQVLTSYFNQREAELQKQLGVQTQRLDEVEVDSESVSKKLNTLYDELESYKSQCKSLKQEMEDQVKNWTYLSWAKKWELFFIGPKKSWNSTNQIQTS